MDNPNVISLLEDEDDHGDDDYICDSDGVIVIDGSGSKRKAVDAEGSRKRQQTAQTNAAIVTDVFPDAAPHYVEKMMQTHQNDTAVVISFMMEKGYDKRTPQKQQAVRNQTTEPDFLSTESFQPSALYKQQAKELLLSDFPFLSVRGASAILQQAKDRYFLAHKKVLAAAKGGGKDEDEHYLRFKRIQNSGHLSYLASLREALGAKCVVSSRRKHKKPLLTDPTLMEETKHVKGNLMAWMNKMSERRNKALNKAKAEREGTGVECACCCDSFPIFDMVACRDEGHCFCTECLRRFAENQLFGQGNLGVDKKSKKPSLEFQCFHGDGCFSGFDRTFLVKSLPAKSLEEYDKIQAMVNMKAAGLGDKVYSCPQCEFQVEVFPSLRVFSCESCGYESCIECRKDSHVPLRCEEAVKEKKETSGRVAVEEAISEALIRKCPSCKKPFIKDSGCNKITCGCGTKCCYLCLTVIKDYKHFCQQPHCLHAECNMCPLYSKDAEDAARAMRQAGLAAAREANAESTLVDKIMK